MYTVVTKNVTTHVIMNVFYNFVLIQKYTVQITHNLNGPRVE